ncbi:MAG: RNB domain-containing ribonuclease [Treponemataceae bacterium]|nr:RNB domain-containing ribonuclease [Treponemataceae bacterium]
MFSKGSIVIYKNQPAVISECGEKYTIQYAAGPKLQTATQSVRQKDIILLCSSASALIQPKELLCQVEPFLKMSENYFEQAKETAELLISDGNANTSINDLAELVFGEYPAEKSWAVYCYFHSSPLFAEILTPDGVFYTCRSAEEAAEIMRKASEKNSEALIKEEFLARLKAKKIKLPDDARFMQEIEAFALGKSSKSKILKDAGFAETDENAHKVLLDTGFWAYYRNPFPTRWGLSMQSATEMLSHPPVEERTKLDAVSYAIDNSWSSDPDDAVCFDGTYLWVHIADPASTVLPDTDIDISARNRGATLYIPEGAARMLAEESLEDYALGLQEWSNALSFRLLLDENGAVKETAVLKTSIKVKRLTYAEADAQCDSKELAPLFDIAKRNIERRKNNGAVFIELPEIHISVEKQSEKDEPLISVNQLTSTKSSAMVREMMLLAGEGAARFAFKNNIPFPFVCQEEPNIPKDLPDGLAGQYKLRRSMRARSVCVTPSNHAGLGLGMYSQVTSPLRRYSDLVAHQQLRAFIDGKTMLDKDTVLERISAGDAAASAAVKAERKSNLHWTLCYLKQNPDWTGTGVIVEIKDNKAVVLIPELAFETQVALPSGAELNQNIQVIPATIDIPKQLITFKIK